MKISSKSIWDICVIQKCPKHIKPNTESNLFNAELYLHIFMIHNPLIFVLLSKIIHLYRRTHLFFLTLEIRKNTTQKQFQRTKSQIFRVSTVHLFWLKRSSVQDFIIHIPVFDVVIYCKSYTVKKNIELTSQDCHIVILTSQDVILTSKFKT